MHTWIICSTKWIRLAKPVCEDLGGSRIRSTDFDFSRLWLTVFDIDSVGFMPVSLSKRVKTNRRNLFVQVIRTMFYGLSLVISLGIEMRLSLYAITCCFILKRHAIFSFYLGLRERYSEFQYNDQKF